MAELLAGHVEAISHLQPCFHRACLQGYAGVALLLIERHGEDWDVDLSNDHKLMCMVAKQAAAAEAHGRGHIDVLRLLHGLYAARGDGERVLQEPCRRAVQHMLIPVPLVFHVIAGSDDLRTVKCLVEELGADPCQIYTNRDMQGHQFAAANGQPEILKDFIEQIGLLPSRIYRPHPTLLHLACGAVEGMRPDNDRGGVLPVVRYLFEQCSLSPTDMAGDRTPAEWAAWNALPQTAAYLRERVRLAQAPPPVPPPTPPPAGAMVPAATAPSGLDCRCGARVGVDRGWCAEEAAAGGRGGA